MALTRRQLLIVLLLRRRLKAKEVEVRRKKECWVRRLYTERTEKGEYHQLVREMKIFDKNTSSNILGWGLRNLRKS